MRTKDCSMLLALDFGHGETSATLIRLSENDSMIYTDLLLSDSNENDHRKIFTAMYLSEDKKRIEIGEDRILNESLPKGKLYKGFKARPDKLNQQKIYQYTKKELVSLFIKAIMQRLYELNHSILKPTDKIQIIVGCPSDDEWLKYKKEYEILLTNASGHPVEVMPESRAAIIKGYHEYRNYIDISKGTLVFDCGSSTLDSTYINPLGKRTSTIKPTDTSKPLGASYIEEGLLELILEKNNITENDVRDIGESELLIRQLKETYYNNEQKSQKPVVGFIMARNEMADYIEVKLQESIMKEIIFQKKLFIPSTISLPEQNTWFDSCKTFMETIKTSLGQLPLQTILLTGGASRMKFVQDLCKTVFNDKTIIIDKEPSFCVSRGLALAGYTDFHSNLLLDTMKNSIKIKLSETFEQTIHSLSSTFAQECYDFMASEFLLWSLEEETSFTLNQVSLEVQNKIQKFINSKKSKELSENTFIHWIDELRPIIVDNVNHNFAQRYPNSIRDIPKFDLNDVKWNQIKTEILQNSTFQVELQNMLNQLDLENFAIVCGKLIVALIGIGISTILGFIPGGIGTKIKENIEHGLDDWLNNSDKIMSKKRREKIYKQVIDNKQTYINNLTSQIEECFHQKFNPQNKEKMCTAVYRNLEETIQEAVDTVSMYFT